DCVMPTFNPSFALRSFRRGWAQPSPMTCTSCGPGRAAATTPDKSIERSELLSTATAVRAKASFGEPTSIPWFKFGLILTLLFASALAGLHSTTIPASADSSADASLFALTNSDRSSNGVHALRYNYTLQQVGEGGYYSGCGFAVHGRSVDMIIRNYFSHV